MKAESCINLFLLSAYVGHSNKKWYSFLILDTQKAQFLSTGETLNRCKLLYNGSTPNLACATATLRQHMSISEMYFRDNFWLGRRTRHRKVASSNPSRSSGRMFFSRVHFVCVLFFGVRSTPVLPQWYIKDPGHSAKSAGGRLHLNMHTPLTQRSRSGLTMPLSGYSEGTYLERSSHATRNGTLGHSRLSSPSHC